MELTMREGATTGGVTRLEVSGELDVQTSPALRDRGVALLDAGAHTVEIDLAGVTFIDSTGLGALVSLQKRCRTAGGSLVVTGCRGPVERLMALTGLDRVFVTDSVV